MKKRVFLIAFFFLLTAFFVDGKDALAGPRLYFEPATGSYDNGEEFTVVLKIDTNGEEVRAADGIINFDNTRLEVKTVTKADDPFFPDMTYNIAADDGRLSIFSFETEALGSASGSGSLAKITFKAIAEGTASVSLLCQSGDDTDSGIWSSSDDIIDCASNGSGSYLIGGGTGGGATPASAGAAATGGGVAPAGGGAAATNTPTSTENTSSASTSSSPTATPSELPETGIEAPFLILILAGGIGLLSGLVFAL